MMAMALVYVAGLISGVVLVAMILAAWVITSYRTIQRRKGATGESTMAKDGENYRHYSSWPDASAA